MKLIKTALLASAFALATTVGFAQVKLDSDAATKGGASIGAGNSGLSGSGNVDANTDANVKAGGAEAEADAKMDKDEKSTTGSGAFDGNGNLKVR